MVVAVRVRAEARGRVSLRLHPPVQPAIAPASGRRVGSLGLGVLASALTEGDHDVA